MVVLVSVALGMLFSRLSTLIGCWAWAQTLYFTFPEHLQNNISDHAQATWFLVGVFLSTWFSLLLALFDHCHSIGAAIMVDVGAIVALPVLAKALDLVHRTSPNTSSDLRTT